MSIDDRNDAISKLTARVSTSNTKPKVSMNRREIRKNTTVKKEKNDIKAKLRPVGREITKSMFP